MKVLSQQLTNFLCSIKGTLWRQIFFEGCCLFRVISHPTYATFETTSFSTVAEPFIDLWTPNALVFMIAWYNVCTGSSTEALATTPCVEAAGSTHSNHKGASSYSHTSRHL